MFYAELRKWIAQAIGDELHPLNANLIVSMLQGAMVLAVATDDDTPLREARDFIVTAG